MDKDTKTILLGLSALVIGLGAMVALAVVANKSNPSVPEIKAQTERIAQYQKCVVELWPVVQKTMPYDGTGSDPLTGRSFQDAYLIRVKEQVADLCEARSVK